mgnify:CR=1 FL=1
MNYNRLETSLIDVIKEEQAKLGYNEGEDQPLLSAQFPESFFWQ